MLTVDQAVSDDWRNREGDESFEGRRPRLIGEAWEAEYAEFCDDKREREIEWVMR
jgi:hypothetical protein